jgi:hypothetical protein
LGPACQKFSQKSMPQYIYYIKSLWRELFRICTFLASAFLGSACQKFSGGGVSPGHFLHKINVERTFEKLSLLDISLLNIGLLHHVGALCVKKKNPDQCPNTSTWKGSI